MRIGIDFDNTIAGYDHLFLAIGEEMGWLPGGFSGSKKEIRDYVRRLDEGEPKWMRMQAMAYGARMAGARIIAGVPVFLEACRRAGHPVFVVSHKTRTAAADPDGTDLRAAALTWMEANGLFAPPLAIPRDHVSFHDTRTAKCERIAALALDVFIDDLEEVFDDPAFPRATRRLLYRSDGGRPEHGVVETFSHWDLIHRAVFPDP